jgi:aminoglycoside phosphotransferase (APT) family kinase protein
LHSDTATRAGEELPVETLTEYLRDKIEGAETGITVKQFLEGHSNLTYLLSCGDGRQYVLRRGPLGPVAPKAHDMGREYHILQAIHPYFSAAPRPYHLCENTGVIGTVFFVMEYRPGTILRNDLPWSFSQVTDYSRRLSESFVDCMVRLHSVDLDQNNLHALGKADGFLTRQVQGWGERWRRARAEVVPEMESLSEWLMHHMPASPAPTLVHNDYKLDNVVFRSVNEVEAVLDWEMATVGDPLADLGLTLCYWTWADHAGLGANPTPSLTSGPGWYLRDQFIGRYASATGRDLSGIIYYEVLGMYKLAVILQQIYYRFRRGQTQDQRFQDFDQRVKALARLAATLVEKQG